MEQNPQPPKTISEKFPEDSDSDPESEVEFAKSNPTTPSLTESEGSDTTLADSSSHTSSGKATPTPSSPREGDLDPIEDQSHPSDGTPPQAEDKQLNVDWGDESQKKPIKTKPKSEKQPPKYSDGASHKREEKVVTPPPFDDSEEPVFHTPTGP